MSDEPRSEAAYAGSGGMPAAALFWVAILFLVSGGLAVYFAFKLSRTPDPASIAVVDPTAIAAKSPDWIDEFALYERNGKLLGSEDLKGKVWVANFFFSTCPGTCRRQTTLVSGLERDFREQDVRFVSITCDPKIDTTEVLRKYAVNFQAPDEWWFLTGDLAYIRRVGAEYFRLAVSEQGHQDRLAVVDKWGNVRERFNWHDDLQMLKMKDLIKQLVEETEPPENLSDEANSAEEPATADKDHGATPATESSVSPEPANGKESTAESEFDDNGVSPENADAAKPDAAKADAAKADAAKAGA